MSPEGRTAGVYRKQHLVPFGEYVPLKTLLFFVGPLVEAVSDFSPGTGRRRRAEVDGQPVSAAICYEVVFGELARQRPWSTGSQLLTTITNDAWYGRSSAPWQHFEQASLRAIEQGRYLVRAANTGISGIVDPDGPRGRAAGPVRDRGAGRRECGFVERPHRSTVRIGDSFAWARVAAP